MATEGTEAECLWCGCPIFYLANLDPWDIYHWRTKDLVAPEICSNVPDPEQDDGLRRHTPNLPDMATPEDVETWLQS